MNTSLKLSATSRQDIDNADIVLYFRPDYTGAVHLILGSFVLETTDTVEEALNHAKRYQPAAKRCGKPVELVPVDSSYQTLPLTIEDWLASKTTRTEKN